MTNFDMYEMTVYPDGQEVTVKVFPWEDGTADAEIYFDGECGLAVSLDRATHIIGDLADKFAVAIANVEDQQSAAFVSAGGWDQDRGKDWAL